MIKCEIISKESPKRQNNCLHMDEILKYTFQQQFEIEDEDIDIKDPSIKSILITQFKRGVDQFYKYIKIHQKEDTRRDNQKIRGGI